MSNNRKLVRFRSLSLYALVYSPAFFSQMPSYFFHLAFVIPLILMDISLQFRNSRKKVIDYFLFFIAMWILMALFLKNLFEYGDDWTSVLYLLVLIYCAVSNHFHNFIRAVNLDLIYSSPKVIDAFLILALYISIPIFLQSAGIGGAAFNFNYTDNSINVLESKYRFPGLMQTYGALGSSIISGYFVLGLFYYYILDSRGLLNYMGRIKLIVANFLIVCAVPLNGSTGIILSGMALIAFKKPSLRAVIITFFLIAFAVGSNEYVRSESGLAYFVGYYEDPSNIENLGTLGWLYRTYFSADPGIYNYIAQMDTYGGGRNFYSGITDVGYINIINYYGILTAMVMMLFIGIFLYIRFQRMHHTDHLSIKLLLIFSLFFFAYNLKEIAFLSSPGPFRLFIFILFFRLYWYPTKYSFEK